MSIESSRTRPAASVRARRLSIMRGALLCLGLLTCLACEREHVAHYRCRGMVRAVEGRGDDARVAIQHEALPAFQDRDGKAAPMGSMTMIFGLAPRLQTEPLSVNQKLSFEFDVTWTESPFLVITRLRALPVDTPLQLGARPTSQ